MIEANSQQGALLAIVSLACLCCVYALCMCCKKKSIQQEDNILYDQDVFNHDHSTYVKRPVTKPNQMSTESLSTSRLSTSMLNRTPNSHSRYQNFPNHGSFEPTYVDPIPENHYVNEDDPDTDPGPYENVFPTQVIQHDSDESEYVNATTE
ncbi:LAT2 domain-containing protein isoform X2 [Myxocyprinus asiaticus]|uniref:LAT2 domain-containing protein isoform X2 n=1 Tax=Myxocyprinus asiaticus TaxID=70543 RepID=UPI002222887B|nr:LAT2 domain-containing protein isoform X2 [Myxocyprinus asiaticus]